MNDETQTQMFNRVTARENLVMIAHPLNFVAFLAPQGAPMGRFFRTGIPMMSQTFLCKKGGDFDFLHISLQ